MAARAPAGIGDPVALIETPALVVDRPTFLRNLQRMAAATQGVRLRPHAKTHRSADVALAQIALGAVGVCCQTVGEAEALVAGGVPDVLVTNEVVSPGKLARLCGLARVARVGVLVDHPAAVDDLGRAARAAGAEVGVLVEIDVGQNRCGAIPGEPAAMLAERVVATEGLRFDGLQAYHGAAQHRRTPQERSQAIEAAALSVRRTQAALATRGLVASVIGGAGTGTFALEAASGLWTELQPGSYVFMDADYAANTWAPESVRFDQALHLVATVISAPTPERAVLDAGLKAVATDSGVPLVAGRDGWQVDRLSDEHATCRTPDQARPGERVHLIPGHIDPTVNLHDWLVVVEAGRVVALWPVTARGASA
ncbi:MAG: DSD1 family PLP-dependent enzyme [Alphaproteobacteria bacterium]|nr:MAG: DSD1 family PLP-dependent enzyme [Alphaproteobacteria bacterium]